MFSRTLTSPFKLFVSIHRRRAHTTHHADNPYPFPSSRHPTPHQIFHLPKNASEADIKARYYDLVRIYHPDKVSDAFISSEAAHTRFQSITHAYNILRGKSPATDSPLSAAPSHDARYPTASTWRARSRHQELYTGKDDRWKDRVILFGLVTTIALVLAQLLSMRQQALSEAATRSKNSESLHARRTPVNISALDADNPDRRLGG